MQRANRSPVLLPSPPPLHTEKHHHLHINGSQTAVGNRTAEGTSQRESRVQVKAAELLGGAGRNLLDDRLDLGRASRR